MRAVTNDPSLSPGRRQFVGLLGAAAASSLGATGTGSAENPPVVQMGNDYFDPIGLYVDPGTTVHFEITAGTHSATAYEDRIPADAPPFDSGTFSEGTFEHTFEQPGTYDYYCIPHESRGMLGRIVVGEPGGPAEERPIPAGSVPDSDVIVERGAVAIEEFGGRDDSGRGMMDHGSGSGMMDGHGSGWMMLVPIGVVTPIFGLIGGVAYWAGRRATPDDPAVHSLEEQYVGGDIDAEEFHSRRAKLETERDPPD